MLLKINKKLPNLVSRTSSREKNLIFLLQPINPESALRQGNSLGPVPREQGEDRENALPAEC